jgi:methyl-accepting chemotaxis protein
VTLVVGGLAALTFRTVETLTIHGPLYTDIVQTRDLIADVLPPPQYLVGAVKLVLEAVAQPEEATVTGLETRLRAVRTEYDQRYAHWAAALPEGPVRSWLVHRSAEHARAIWAVIERQVLPLLEKREARL